MLFKKLVLSLLLCSVPALAADGAKISAYPRATTLGDNDLFITAYYGGSSYTTNKGISFTNLVSQLIGIVGSGGGGSVYVAGSQVTNPNFATNSDVRFSASTTNVTASLVGVRRVVNVADFLTAGEEPNGTDDNDTTVEAAYATLSSTDGGELFFPEGTWKFNLIITKPNVTITGISQLRDTSVTPSFTTYFIASDLSNPVIQVGNDSGWVRGVLIRNVSLNGDNGGTKGLRFAGGAFECRVENSAVAYFDTGIHIEGGTSYPASLIYFDSVHGHPDISANNGRGWLIKNASNYPTSYTTEIDISNSHWDGPSSGTSSYVMEIDSCEVKFINNYFDLTGGHGIKLSNTIVAADTWLQAVNSNIDGGASSVVIHGFDNNRTLNGLVTFECQINGKYADLDGTEFTPPPTMLRRLSAARGEFQIWNPSSVSGGSVLRFVDNVNSKQPFFFANAGFIYARPENGAAFSVANHTTGTSLFQVNGTDGATFFFGAGINAGTLSYFDSNKQLKSVTTGLGITNTVAGVLSNNIAAGSNISLTAGANGQITIASTASGGVAGTMVSSGSWTSGDYPKASDTTGTNFVRVTPTGTGVAVNSTLATVTNLIRSGRIPLTDAATITFDISQGENYIVTLGGARTLAAPTNGRDGQQVKVWFVQDGTGNRTISFPTNYLFGTDITGVTLTTNASKADVVTFEYFSTNSIVRVLGVLRGYQF